MRLRKVKNADITINECDYVIKKPENNKGEWRKVFNNDNPIHIEIGMGKGKFIIEKASISPNINFIGIEMYDSVMLRAVERLNNLVEKINNLKLIKYDAKNIENIFDKEISCIYLNFSDPWPKARHEKRRLTSHEFLKRYDNIFIKDNIIIQKTDNIDFFNYSIESIKSYGYNITNISFDLCNENNTDNITTEYEEKFIDKGVKINKLEARK